MAESVVLPPVPNRGSPHGFIAFHLSQNTPASAHWHRDGRAKPPAWSHEVKIRCPCCGETHEILLRETYIDGALRDATDRLPSC
jgi:hypothetical protein